MKRILCLLASYLLPTIAFADSLREKMLVGGGDNSANANTNVTVTENFLKIAQSWILGLTGMIAIGIFIWLGFRLFSANGNEEEFKKTWIAFGYAVIGLAVIPLAFVVVKIVLGFRVFN